jgi:SAM-dependent methyltransferase
MSIERACCPVCKKREVEVLIQVEDYEYWTEGVFPFGRCVHCSAVYLVERPDAESIGSYYPEEYSPFDSGGSIGAGIVGVMRKRNAARIAKHLKVGASLLEIGCATGDLLLPLRDDFGLEVSGLEISEYASSLAREKHGLNVFTGVMGEVDFKGRTFDAVVMRHVLEHLHDPQKDLDLINDLLKPGGYLLIEVPNYDSIERRLFGKFWSGYHAPRHLFLPDTKSLKKLLEESKFNIIKINHSAFPNNFINSINNMVSFKNRGKKHRPLFSYKNPLLALLFLPFSMFQFLLGKSGRIVVEAKKI